MRPGTLPPSAGSSPSRCARSLVASRSLCVICMAAYTAMLPPLECPPIIMPGDSFAERKRFVLSKIESAYRYADSCDGTGQRTAILKSSFQPTSVPSVPRNATYRPKSAPKSKVIAANCCCCALIQTFGILPHPQPAESRRFANRTQQRKPIIVHFRGIRNKHPIVAFGAQQFTNRHGRHRLASPNTGTKPSNRM